MNDKIRVGLIGYGYASKTFHAPLIIRDTVTGARIGCACAEHWSGTFRLPQPTLGQRFFDAEGLAGGWRARRGVLV